MNSDSEAEELFQRAIQRFRELQRERPQEIGAFVEYLKHARADGALSAKTKELMSLAISLATHCIPCVIWHTRMSLKRGASRNEILETALVAIGMGGGLAYTQTMYLLEALEAWEKALEEDNAKA